MATVMQKIQAFLNLIPHWVILVLSGAAGALLTYFQQQSSADLVHSFMSLTLLKPILAGGVTVFLTAVVNLMKAAPWANWAPSPSVPMKPVGGYLPPTLPVLMLAILFSAGCGVGQIFGPGSNVPSDLEADASCVAGQLLVGNLDPASVAAKCTLAVDQTFQDLWTFLVHGLAAKGKLTASQASQASESLAKAMSK